MEKRKKKQMQKQHLSLSNILRSDFMLMVQIGIYENTLNSKIKISQFELSMLFVHLVYKYTHILHITIKYLQW